MYCMHMCVYFIHWLITYIVPLNHCRFQMKFNFMNPPWILDVRRIAYARARAFLFIPVEHPYLFILFIIIFFPRLFGSVRLDSFAWQLPMQFEWILILCSSMLRTHAFISIHNVFVFTFVCLNLLPLQHHQFNSLSRALSLSLFFFANRFLLLSIGVWHSRIVDIK